MGRTKGATNKKDTVSDGNTKEPQKRGRKPGQVIEREPAIIVDLNSKYRVKIDKYNKTLQEKCKSEEVTEENEDAGWKNLGYFNKWEYIFNKLVDELSRQKAKKELIIPFERYFEIFNKSKKDVTKMFAPIDDVKMK